MCDELPFQVEYAKTGRASCKNCKENIGKDTLRIAIMIQSPFSDGRMAHWYHLHCFFEKKNTLRNVEEIANFRYLLWEDQDKIKKLLEKAARNAYGNNASCEFSVEYAKTARSTCRGCSEKILKGAVRITKLDSDDYKRNMYGSSQLWYHTDCFVEAKKDLGYSDFADKLVGFSALKDEDKKELGEKIGIKFKRKAEEDTPPSKNKKSFFEEITEYSSAPILVEDDSPPKNGKAVCKENSKLKIQNEQLFYMREKLAKHLVKKDIISLLNYNKQDISIADDTLLDHLSDCMVFGALKICPDCKNACPRFENNAYICPGYLTEWTKCQYETKFPEREKFIVPDELKNEFIFLKDYKCVVQERLFNEVVVVASTSKKDNPLDDFVIAFIGKLPNQITLETQIKELGASISENVEKSVNLCISTKDEVTNMSDEIIKAFLNDLHVVSPDFVESIRKGSPVAFSIKEHLISTWSDDPILKFGIKQEHRSKKDDEDKVGTDQTSASFTKIPVHGVAAVDPESGLQKSCHVYQKIDNIYNVVLAFVDISKGTNSFYKLQLLESNKGSRYHLFRQWGRVGTGIGGKKVQQFAGVEAAITEFESIYEEKTLNKWWDRNNFVKKPGGMYPLDLDYGMEDNTPQILKPGDNSKLSKPVQELICLIFDIEAMKTAMVEFQIDLKKMPLGKLSKNQINLAYKVLCEAQQILMTGSNAAKITDVTNRFFTLIPHNFGMKKPPLLDDEEIIKSKLKMVVSLMEIEFAYNLIKGKHNEDKNHIDRYYQKLNTDIEVLEKESLEYKRVHTYLKNTHGKTHNQYSLELNEVFKINRHGENERYQKFKDLHNKKLLWHGSRLTNFVGILSQGLRIAPPEAPVHGYAFGKGIYFADMASKSANYSMPTDYNNPVGLLLLCEVALGNMHEMTHPLFIEMLPTGKHSTLGMGNTIPDPNTKTVVGDVEIPYGKPVSRKSVSNGLGYDRFGLLYNEYIVYDVNQVNIKYLLKVDFKWKR